MSDLATELAVLQRLLNTDGLRVTHYEVAEEGLRVLFEDADGRPGEVTVIVVEAQFPEEQRQLPRLPGARFESQPSWSLADLDARNRPRYWNREHLVERLAHHRNLVASVAAEFSVSDDEIKRFKLLHDIKNARREWIALEWESGDYDTQAELAKAVGEKSEGNISKIVGRSTPPGKAVWKEVHRNRIKRLIRDGLNDHQIYTDLQTAGLTQSFEKVAYFISRLRPEVSRGE